MKTVHVPYCFYPDPVGGTEIYVETLALQLQKRNIECVIAAASDRKDMYWHNELKVHRFALDEAPENFLEELYGSGGPVGAMNFGKMLDDEKPDIVHFHATTRGASLLMVREAKKRRIPTVLTYHTPTVSCARGTLLHFGSEVCDGKLETTKCTACVLESKNMPRFASQLLSLLPLGVSNQIMNKQFQGKLWTVLQMKSLINLSKETLHKYLYDMDRIVATADWVREVLKLNGVKDEKMMLSSQGLGLWNESDIDTEQVSKQHDVIKMIFMGRLDSTKGLDIITQALSLDPNLPIELDIYAVYDRAAANTYQQKIISMVDKDVRIHFRDIVSSNKVRETIRQYDVMCIPSQWLETGPLVALEAFSVKVPVLGSKLGGLEECIEDGENGVLVDAYHSPEAWLESLSYLVEHRSLLEKMSQNIIFPRTMQHVADEMQVLYESLNKAALK